MLLGLLAAASFAAEPEKIPRPEIRGIARMTYWVSDLQVAREFYGDFLGFEAAFSYPSERGTVTAYKVSDRQFIEVIVNPGARDLRRLVAIGLETSDVEGMRRYLASKGVAVPAATTLDQAGNETFTVTGPDGHPIEFLHYGAVSLHRKSAGTHLPDNRSSRRIHHAGFTITDEASANRFFVDLLGCEQTWRANEGSAQPNFVYLRLPDCVENIEYMINGAAPEAHACLVTEDMQTTLYTLGNRPGSFVRGRPMIGKGRRWLLQLRSADGTPVEFTEPYTIR